jgi:hypothetical protein
MRRKRSYLPEWTFALDALTILLMLEYPRNMNNSQESTTTHPDLNYTVHYVAASSNLKPLPYLRIVVS